MIKLRAEKRSIKQCIEAFLAYCKDERNLSDGSIYAFQRYLLKLNAFLEKKDISDIGLVNKELIRQFLRELPGRTPFIVSTATGAFRQFGKYLVASEHQLNDNPFIDLSLPRLSKPLPSNIPSPQEISQVIEAPFKLFDKSFERLLDGILKQILKEWARFEKMINELLRRTFRDWAIMEFLYSTGVSVGELVAVKNQDVDLKEGYVKVSTNRTKKGRFVVLNKKSTAAIKAYNSLKRKFELLPDKPLFLNESGEEMSIHRINDIIEKYIPIAEIKKDIHPHTFRHAFAVHLLENGAGMRDVQELLGHNNVETTQLYSRINIKKMTEEHSKLFGESKTVITDNIEETYLEAVEEAQDLPVATLQKLLVPVVKFYELLERLPGKAGEVYQAGAGKVRAIKTELDNALSTRS
ncbi:MAG: tyrosine-type recombinase/integrase [Candidatus Omnitrophica bacterium]|nr:tyrosine-type recombinase/integrase [Candidatus Omnitrophota bacterium]